MNDHEVPILQFDNTTEAVISPPCRPGLCFPDRAVACFRQSAIDTFVRDTDAQVIHNAGSNMGLHPVYQAEVFGKPIAVFQPGLGAPFAAALVEEVIALGCRKIIVIGSCGVLDSSVPKGMLVVPTSAVRDEGTSYHYLPPGAEAAPAPQVVPLIEKVLQAHGCRYALGKTWTTDAIYRETRGRVQRRCAEGCLTVEMEAAALFAVASFRNIEIGLILSCNDDVSGDVWNPRREDAPLTGSDKLMWLAAEICALM